MLVESSLTCREKYHENEPLDYYCQECKVCICDKCGQSRHTYHTKVDIQQAAEEQKLKMQEVLQEMKAKISKHETEMAIITELLKKSREKIAAARNKLLTTVEELTRALKEHEIAMVTKLDILEKAEQRDHAIQFEHFQISVTQLKTSVEYCEAILKRNISAEILQSPQAAIERCKGLLDSIKMDIYKPLHVCYKTNEEDVDKLRCAVPGQVFVSNTDPWQSIAGGHLEVGKESRITIITKDSEGKQCYNNIDQILVEIQTPSGNEIIDNVRDHTNGEYTMYFTPDCHGKHEVIIDVNGEQLFWSIHAQAHQYRQVGSFGSRGKGRAQFKDPWHIAINDKTGKIAVVDRKNERVQLFSAGMIYLTEFGQKGPSAKKLNDLTSVAFAKSSDVIIIASGAMYCFAESGQFIKTIKNKQVKEPFHLTIACDGRMVVCDRGDRSIKVLSPEGTELIQSFSAPDCDESPWIAVYHQDVFFVSYPSAHCVKVFNKEGETLYDIGKNPQELSKPLGLTVDKFNNLIVCDGDGRNPKVFTLEGKFLNTFFGDFFEWHECPSVAVSKTGAPFITDTCKNAVSIFL